MFHRMNEMHEQVTPGPDNLCTEGGSGSASKPWWSGGIVGWADLLNRVVQLRFTKPFALLVLYGVISVTALVVAYWARFDGQVPVEYLNQMVRCAL